MMIHKSSGILRVHGQPGKLMWISVDAGRDLCEYYIWLTSMRLRHRFTITRPLWDAHISIVRNEIPFSQIHFDTLDGVEIDFEYDHEIYRSGRHFCMNAYCERAERIRLGLGLAPHPRAPFHLTIGVLDGNIHPASERMK